MWTQRSSGAALVQLHLSQLNILVNGLKLSTDKTATQAIAVNFSDYPEPFMTLYDVAYDIKELRLSRKVDRTSRWGARLVRHQLHPTAISPTHRPPRSSMVMMKGHRRPGGGLTLLGVRPSFRLFVSAPPRPPSAHVCCCFSSFLFWAVAERVREKSHLALEARMHTSAHSTPTLSRPPLSRAAISA